MKNQTLIVVLTIIIGVVIISVAGMIFANNVTTTLTNPNSNAPSSENIAKSGVISTTGSKPISITGQNNVQTIDNPSQVVILTITGQYNKITIAKDTQISQLIITGQSNTVNLCEGIHSPQITKTGTGNNINYNSC